MFDEGDIVITPQGAGTVVGHGRQMVEIERDGAKVREYQPRVEVLLHDGELVDITDDDGVVIAKHRHGTLMAFAEDALSPEG